MHLNEENRKPFIIFAAAGFAVAIVVLALAFPRLTAKKKILGSVETEQVATDTDLFNAPLANQNANPITQLNTNGAVPAPAAEPQPEKPQPPPLLVLPPPPPPPVDMNRIKKQGCVADGLLTGYSPENIKFVDLINRSNCYYLHRAIETWLAPPDFSRIESRKNQITKKDVVYGMFIAEAIGTKTAYRNEKNQRDFSFSDMCRKGSDNFWGEHTCQPAFSSTAYRDYLEQITHQAIDLGIQSFTFGQIYWQEGSENKYAQEIVRDMRAYAKESGVDVIIGAQTGAISNPDYLKIFDYIEGGVGINGNGDIESGPCLSKRGSCWALLWNKKFAQNANNVLLHLDWTGITSDDLDIFARMSPQKRAQTLQNLHSYFVSRNMGFMMPLFGVLDKNNGGCYGPEKKYYSPDNR
ncbi:MAG: hypothetical protein V1690_00380, partial [Candidatus Moraniibacteriota bacterium]